ncbi:flagellar hook assembly protein FlgD, partial [bacterium]|nr:flagellar hook assembly protein FlgD [bacterium]
MMVDSVSSGQASGILQAAAGGSDIMGKDSFLQLLVTQLKNQDPLQPMDNTQFVAQLAQFSSLEQVQNLNGLMSQNNDLTLSVHNALMTNLIGKVVSVDSDQVYWDGNEASAIEYDVEEPGKVSFEIYDQDGSLVRTVAGEDKLAGTYTFQWDGLDS